MRLLVSFATLPKRIPGRDHFAAVGKGHFAHIPVAHIRGRHHRPAALLLGNACKEGGVSPKIALGPFIERVIVALGTLDLNSQEGPGRAGRQLFGLQFEGRVEQGRSRIGWLAGGENQLAGHFGVRTIFGEGVAEPVLKSVAGPRIVGRRRVGQQDLPPDVGQMTGIAGACQKRVDQAGPLVGCRIVEERASFAYPRNPSGQVEVSPPQEFRVGRAGRRLDRSVLPGRLEQGVDARSHLPIDVGGVLARTVGNSQEGPARKARVRHRRMAPSPPFFSCSRLINCAPRSHP